MSLQVTPRSRFSWFIAVAGAFWASVAGAAPLYDCEIGTQLETVRHHALQAHEHWQKMSFGADLTDDEIAGQIHSLYEQATDAQKAGKSELAIAAYKDLCALANDAATFAEAIQGDSLVALIAYKRHFPEGAYQSRLDEEAWKMVIASPGVSAYMIYAHAFPAGRYINEAAHRLHALDADHRKAAAEAERKYREARKTKASAD